MALYAYGLSHDKVADSVELDSYASQLPQYKCSWKRIVGPKLEDLPGLEELQTAETSNGKTKVVRGDNGVAYSCNMSEQKWDKLIMFSLLTSMEIKCLNFLHFCSSAECLACILLKEKTTASLEFAF